MTQRDIFNLLKEMKRPATRHEIHIYAKSQGRTYSYDQVSQTVRRMRLRGYLSEDPKTRKLSVLMSEYDSTTPDPGMEYWTQHLVIVQR